MKVITVLSFCMFFSCATFQFDKDIIENHKALNQNAMFDYAASSFARDVDSLPIMTDGKSYVVASWFEGSDTEKILQAIESGAYYILVPRRDYNWSIEPLFIHQSDIHIIFEEGCIIEAKKDGLKDRGDSLINIENVENVTISGYGATFLMHKADYLSSEYEWSEWRMAIVIKSSANVTVEGLLVDQSGGDGIYVGAFMDQNKQFKAPSRNIVLQDLILNNHYRQGISVITVDGLTIKNVNIYNTYGTAPAAGIDFEPNRENQLLKNIIVEGCDIRNNQGPGIQIYLVNLTEKSPVVDIRIVDTTVDNWPFSLFIAGNGNNPHGEIIIESSDLSGFWLPWMGDNLTITEIN